MIQPQSILRPARPAFIWTSILLGLLFNLFPWGGDNFWVPDVLLLLILFWAMREPQYIGIGVAFLAGLIMDVHKGSLLGEHAMIYAITAFSGMLLQRRLVYFSFTVQALHFLPVFLFTHTLIWCMHFMQNDVMHIASYWATPFIQMLVWPVLAWFLMIPQRLSEQKDYTRPI